MKIYKVKDLQINILDIEILSEIELKEKAFMIMKDRVEAIDDELSEEFNQFVQKGFESFELKDAIELLNLWEYEVTEVQN